MRRYFYLLFFVLFILQAGKSSAFLGNSLRLRGMGEELSGLIVDEYSDIYRNPAYLYNIKNLRIFVQHNTHNYTELKIAPFMRNQGAEMAGIVIPLSKYGTWALVGELRPSSEGSFPAPTETREDRGGYYVVYYKSYENSSKYTIRNFKTAYSLRISKDAILGLDFTYLKNYNYSNSISISSRTDRSLADDSLLTHIYQCNRYLKDDSPDAQRLSLGLILFPDKRNSLDLNLLYEHLGYTIKNYRTAVSEGYRAPEDSIASGNIDDSHSPVRGKAYGLECDLKLRLPDEMILSLLGGIRYEKKENTVYGLDCYYSYSSQDTTYRLSEAREVLTGVNKNSSLDFVVGLGIEKDFSPSVKIYVGAKGFGNRVESNSSESMYQLRQIIIDDSTVTFDSTSSFSDREWIINSFRLALPIGLEAKLHPVFKVRLGGMWLYRYEENDEGYSTSTSSHYSQGLSFTLKDKIYMDVYIMNDIVELKNWMVNIGYNF